MKKSRNPVLRRDVLKIGLGLVALTGLAGCATPATPTPLPPTPAPDPTATSGPVAQATSEPAAPTSPPAPEETTAPAEEAIVFAIDPGRSEARFTLNEKLMGNPTTVVGRTSKVAGEIRLSLDNPAGAQIGVIQIDARDFATDSDMRNRAIRNFILQSAQDQFQYITFEPTAIEGLPATASVGDTVSFKVTGNLKIRDIVQPVVFDTTVTVTSRAELSGLAQATVMRSAFGLTIPQVPNVADVTEEVALELEFVAVRQ